jgi:hypothetical protein
MGTPKGVQVPCVKIEMNRNEQISTSRSQGGTGDRVVERRICETRKSMDKNHIQGRPGQVSWHNTATALAAIAAPEACEAFLQSVPQGG